MEHFFANLSLSAQSWFSFQVYDLENSLCTKSLYIHKKSSNISSLFLKTKLLSVENFCVAFRGWGTYYFWYVEIYSKGSLIFDNSKIYISMWTLVSLTCAYLTDALRVKLVDIRSIHNLDRVSLFYHRVGNDSSGICITLFMF